MNTPAISTNEDICINLLSDDTNIYAISDGIMPTSIAGINKVPPKRGMAQW